MGVRTGVDEYNQPTSDINSGYVGEFKHFGFETVPPHCLACDGSEVSRETYSELFEVFGETFGAGDGVSTFNLPDLRGAFLRCIGGNAAELGTAQGDAIRNIATSSAINNTIMAGKNQLAATSNPPYSIQNGYYSRVTGGNEGALYMAHFEFDASATGIPVANENRPVNYAVNICVVYE